MKKLFSFVCCGYSSLQVPYAFMFDIDGVLVNGSTPVPGAKECLQDLIDFEIPIAFLTNGGGVFEKDYLEQTLDELGLDDPELVNKIPIVLSHTPMKELVEEYRDQNILVVGAKVSYDVCLSYGFENAIFVDHVAQLAPEIHTHHHDHYRSRRESFPSSELVEVFEDIDIYDIEFAALLLFYHSVKLDRDLQIMVDLLRSNGYLGTESSHQKVKLYTSNSDFLYGSKFPLPRFGQGFQHDCLRAGYERVTGRELIIEKEYGKPESIQYEYAVRALIESISGKSNDDVEFGEIVMIGDNPYSDIKGAKEMGFSSCLVETGVYQKGEELEDDVTPDFIFSDVRKAVEYYLSK